MIREVRRQTDTLIESFYKLFITIDERRLRSDVNIGTSLSGGLDSSAVVAAINTVKDSTTRWKNIGFTASFPGFEKDEVAFSKKIVEHFNMQQKVIEPTPGDLARSFYENDVSPGRAIAK